MIEIVNDQEIEIQTVIGVAEVIKIGNGNDQEKEVIITDQSIERNKIESSPVPSSSNLPDVNAAAIAAMEAAKQLSKSCMFFLLCNN